MVYNRKDLESLVDLTQVFPQLITTFYAQWERTGISQAHFSHVCPRQGATGWVQAGTAAVLVNLDLKEAQTIIGRWAACRQGVKQQAARHHVAALPTGSPSVPITVPRKTQIPLVLP